MCLERQCILRSILELEVLWTILTLPCLKFSLQECSEFWLENALFTSTWFAVKKICCSLMLFSEVRSEWWSQEVLVGARVVDNLLARAQVLHYIE
jgi:hypothetical protein